MKTEELKALDKIEIIPTLPAVAVRILEIILNEKSSAKDAAKIVESDQGLSTKVLRVVNSAAYGLRQKVSTIPHAIALIGFSALKALVLSISVYEELLERTKETRFDKVLFWQHCLAVAACARILAKEIKYDQPDEAYIAGLLHDIGKVVTDINFKTKYHQTLDRGAKESIDFCQIENEELNFNHCDAGAYVLSKWNLPQILVDSVQYHHSDAELDLPKRNKELVCIVNTADFLCWMQGLGSIELKKPPKLSKTSEQLFKFSQMDVNNIIEAIDKELEVMAEAFNFSPPDPKAFQLALQKANIELGRLTTLYDESKKVLERRVRELMELNEAIRRARQTLDIDTVRAIIVEAAQKGLGFDRSIFMSVDYTNNLIRCINLKHEGTLEFDTNALSFTLDKETDYIRKIKEKRKPFKYPDEFSNSFLGKILEILDSNQIGVATIIANKDISGFIIVDNSLSKLPISEVALESLGILAEEAGLAIENAMLFEKTQELAIKDELTAVFNRRQIISALNYEIDRAKRYVRPLSICMCDLDFFKYINDTFGHLAGDKVLQDVAKLIKGGSRDSDIIGRYGGEEFLVILPETDIDKAVIYAERIRKLVERYGISRKDIYPSVKLTISIGLAKFDMNYDKNKDDIIAKADRALYSAKERGRNRVCIHQ